MRTSAATTIRATTTRLQAVDPLRLLLIDGEEHTALLLEAQLREQGLGTAHRVADAAGLPPALEGPAFDAAILNFHYGRGDSLACCSALKGLAAATPVIVLSSPGPALVQVLRWRERTGSIDAIVEKPLSGNRLFAAIRDQVASRRLSSMVPHDALEGARGGAQQGELAEMTLLFTDVRRSTQLAASVPPRELFERLNALLSRHARIVREHGGSVIKFTGDGLMAAFRGPGRSHVAVRCGRGIQADPAGRTDALESGVGVCDGLVMTGMIGDASRQQYDVIGATVHMAARLCSLAAPGQVLASADTVRASRFDDGKPAGRIAVRGFDDGVECVVFERPE